MVLLSEDVKLVVDIMNELDTADRNWVTISKTMNTRTSKVDMLSSEFFKMCGKLIPDNMSMFLLEDILVDYVALK